MIDKIPFRIIWSVNKWMNEWVNEWDTECETEWDAEWVSGVNDSTS